MTKILFFSDPHLGLKRAAHTTTQSSKRLNDKLIGNVLSIPTQEADFSFCLGDLFDTYRVDPMTLIQGNAVVQSCTHVITGNHDVSNRDDQISSLQSLHMINGNTDRVQTPLSVYTVDNQLDIVTIDHHLTQQIFDKTLDSVRFENGRKRILLLHCNYNSPFADDDSSLNLTEKQAKELLRYFEYILIGHEHQPRTELDGRVVMVGNTHPTSFSDLSDKFYITIDLDQGELSEPEMHKIWAKDEGYLSLPWTELSGLLAIGDGVEFVEVTGEADPRHLPQIAKQIADIWKLSDKLLMVRNKVVALDLVPEMSSQVVEAKHVSIPDMVSESLADSPLQPLWKSYIERAGYE